MSMPSRYRLVRKSGKPNQTKKRGLKKYLLTITILPFSVGVAWTVSRYWPNGPSNHEPVAQHEPSTQEQEAAKAYLEEQNGELKAVIDDWVKSQSTYDWAVVVRGLDSDQRGVSHEPNKEFRAASLYKLYLMLSVFKDYSVSELNSAGLENCVDLMLRISDNPCGETVGRLVGWSRADAEIQRAGYIDTKISIAQPVTTAAETAKLMEDIYNRQVGGSSGKQFIMDKLAKQSWNEGIPAGCSGCKSFNKTGDLNFVRHDAAIISNDSGSYILVIFSNGAPYLQIAELTRKINLVMQGN